MNSIRNYFILTFLFLSLNVIAQVNLNINISYPAPSYLNDWAYGRSGMATLVLNQTEGQLIKIKFKTQLQNSNGTVIASSNNATAAIYSIRSGANVFSLDKILQQENLRFADGSVQRNIQTSGKLPSGNYQLCVQVIGSVAGSTREMELLKVPVCRPFTQANFQLPTLLSPVDKSWLDAATAKSVITFRWSSIVPRTMEHVTYRLQVFEVKEHQKPMQALRSNMPILNVNVLNTQYSWRPQLNFDESKGSIFIWTIQTIDIKGNPITTSDGYNLGWSEPRTFGVYNKLKNSDKQTDIFNDIRFE